MPYSHDTASGQCHWDLAMIILPDRLYKQLFRQARYLSRLVVSVIEIHTIFDIMCIMMKGSMI
jgi:hypothetical protein